MENEILLNSESYNDFIRCLSNLVGVCNDIDIRGGILRQRSDDNTNVFEMNLTSIIEDMDISMTHIKDKIELLKTFQGQDVTLVEDAESFTFSDEYSSLTFLKPSMGFLSNNFMSDEEIDSIWTFVDEDLICETELPSLITERIKVVTKNFNVLAIQIQFEDDSASICSSTASNDQSATFVKDIELNMNFDKSVSNLSVIPFTIDHDTDITFKIFKKEHEDRVSYGKFSTNLGDVDIVLYTRNAIIPD